uniref:Reverse transcriptase domain-containing protein n=1 Tax=Aegilops tauschii subsp. strangulata TaxID=200361 RepID=A0A453EH50_AEGTS
PIWHKEGLRQGDSLSPQLFVLAVDTLGRLIRRAHDTGILQPLHPRRPIPAIAAVKEILDLFGRAASK